MTEIYLKITISLHPQADSAVLYDQLADALWAAESKDTDLFDSFIGGSLETGELELSICARGSDETAAKLKAHFALDSVLSEAGLARSVSKHELLELI